MAIISSYSTLQTKVAEYLARDDLTDYIPDFIQYAENKLYRTLNLRNEETALSVAISAGVAAVPSDFKALKFAYYDQTPVQLLKWVPVEELYRDYPDRSSAEVPLVISREGSNFVFGPVADGGTLKGVYYAKQDPLRTTSPSWYATNAPEVLLYGALLEAAPFIRDDERLVVWQQLFQNGVDSLIEEQNNAEVTFGQLRQRAS